jgi:hypothetical protein
VKELEQLKRSVDYIILPGTAGWNPEPRKNGKLVMNNQFSRI